MKKFSQVLTFAFMLFVITVSAQAAMIMIGVENIRLPGGDKDYNDMVLSLSGNVNIVPDGTSVWRPMVAPNGAPPPYWDNGSWDFGGGSYNIGYFVTGTGGWAGNPASPNWSVDQTQYWGTSSGGADQSFVFSMTGGANTTLLLEAAAWNNQNTLYWFLQGNPSDTHLLFAGLANPGATASFTPGGNFGLMLVSPGGTYTTLCNANQFSVFRQAGGGEIPEPHTLALAGGGLLLLGALRKRVRR